MMQYLRCMGAQNGSYGNRQGAMSSEYRRLHKGEVI